MGIRRASSQQVDREALTDEQIARNPLVAIASVSFRASIASNFIEVLRGNGDGLYHFLLSFHAE